MQEWIPGARRIEIGSSLQALRSNPEGQKSKDWIASSLALLAMTATMSDRPKFILL